MGVRALCLACVLASVAPRAFAQAPGIPTASLPGRPSAATAAPAPSVAPSEVAPAAATPIEVAPAEAAPAPSPARTAVTLEPSPSAATPVPADSPGLSPTIFWIAASTTIIVASLGGFEALHVRDLYDQASGLPTVSPEREPLHDKMKTAEVTADVLLLGSLALAVGTTLLAFHIDWSGHERATDELARRPTPSAAGRRWW